MNDDIQFYISNNPAGLIHLVFGQFDVLRGPVGVVAYVLFAPLLRFLPARWSANYLTATSLLLALLTVGANYTFLIAALAVYAFLVTRSAERAVFVYRRPPRLAAATALTAVSIPYALALLYPQPFFLPPAAEAVYFYLHWAGLAYLFLRASHVLVDRCRPVPPDTPHAGTLAAIDGSTYFAYMLFGPTLRMGPLYRYTEFADQLNDHRTHQTWHNVGAGVIRIVVGLIRLAVMMLVLTKDNLLPLLPLGDDPSRLFPAFNVDPASLPYWQVLLGAYIQTIRIYLWISGYTDLAIGVGHFFGFHVPENFNFPWIATSIAEYWRRFHLTMGAWLRDYVFIPLGGSRRRVYLSYLLTFTFCGFWHGLFLSYVCWGLSQGIGLSINRWWTQSWSARRQANTPLYQTLLRYRLVQSRFNRIAAWALTCHYQLISIAWFMDEPHAGKNFIPVLFGLDPLT